MFGEIMKSILPGGKMDENTAKKLLKSKLNDFVETVEKDLFEKYGQEMPVNNFQMQLDVDGDVLFYLLPDYKLKVTIENKIVFMLLKNVMLERFAPQGVEVKAIICDMVKDKPLSLTYYYINNEGEKLKITNEI